MFKHNGKPIKAMLRDLQAMQQQLPAKVGALAVGFFLDNFKLQGFQGDNGLQKWKLRKDQGKKSRGRALLVDSGALRRSIVKVPGFSKVVVAAGPPAEKYADAHNFGVNKTVSVTGHNRIKTATATARYSNIQSRRTRSTTVKYSSGTSAVQSHSRKMNLPQRKFIGASRQLDLKIKALIDAEIRKVLGR